MAGAVWAAGTTFQLVRLAAEWNTGSAWRLSRIPYLAAGVAAAVLMVVAAVVVIARTRRDRAPGAGPLFVMTAACVIGAGVGGLNLVNEWYQLRGAGRVPADVLAEGGFHPGAWLTTVAMFAGFLAIFSLIGALNERTKSMRRETDI